MNELQLVNCVTLLTQSKTYSIEGILYRYVNHSDSINHTQYLFRPLPQQRKSADLKLNRSKVLRKVYEVPELYGQRHAVMTTETIQQSLF
ncbi:MAG: hypothetical protein DSM106950_41450 [Stigonema ocellatum SAG 48.90 = DSM 106950]|nr:hypothetical protein [Stigonema ocellatum SAG 48.90 = DSM 106950]